MKLLRKFTFLLFVSLLTFSVCSTITIPSQTISASEFQDLVQELMTGLKKKTILLRAQKPNLIQRLEDFDKAIDEIIRRRAAAIKTTTTTTPRPCLGNELSQNLNLTLGDCLESSNQCYKLVFQNDGNLVLKHKSGEILWSSGTDARAYAASVSLFGEFYVEDPFGVKIFTRGTKTYFVTMLSVQDDGNLVLWFQTPFMTQRQVTWNSETGPNNLTC